MGLGLGSWLGFGVGLAPLLLGLHQALELDVAHLSQRHAPELRRLAPRHRSHQHWRLLPRRTPAAATASTAACACACASACASGGRLEGRSHADHVEHVGGEAVLEHLVEGEGWGEGWG